MNVALTAGVLELKNPDQVFPFVAAFAFPVGLVIIMPSFIYFAKKAANWWVKRQKRTQNRVVPFDENEDTDDLKLTGK